MSDDLIVIRLVFVLLQKFSRAGKSDLSDVFLNFIRSHTDTVIAELQCLLLGIDNYVDLVFAAIREGVFAHDFKLFQLGDSVAAVGNQLADKDIVVGI